MGRGRLMKAQAGGKLVISGAYSVLRGAPALVAAVDRYVIADSNRPAEYQSQEVIEALKIVNYGKNMALTAPYYDAHALRDAKGHDGRKLGLGSSAAIVVASLGACLAGQDEELASNAISLRERVYPVALKAHRIAQGGGSGIDVAAATFGGLIRAQRPHEGGLLEVISAQLPSALHVEAWAMPNSAITSEFVARFNLFEKESPDSFLSLLKHARSGAIQAAHIATSLAEPLPTLHNNSKCALEFISALRTQYEAFCELGNQAMIPIVLPVVQELNRRLPSQCLFMPSGAGGGDITLYFGISPSSEEFRKSALAHDLELVPLQLAAPGLTLLTA